MKKFTLITLVALALASCAKTDDDMAQKMLTRINSLYESGNYRAALDSITVLRDRYPAAIEARKAALVVWQNASLKMAQADVAQTDILLQQTIAKIAMIDFLKWLRVANLKLSKLKAMRILTSLK